MRLIVTGGAGFIGSALVCRAVASGHDVLTIDKLTYAGRREALTDVIKSPHHRLLVADIVDGQMLESTFCAFDPDAILHLAAESHVDRSIDGPGTFVRTNVHGTVVLLEAALRHWSRLQGPQRDTFRFIQVSTDEVFGALGTSGSSNANSCYAPNSPYAASKAAADHFARAWLQTYGLPVIITNCVNNYGPRQHAEKLIPTVIRYALADSAIPIYGMGVNVRDWLYVEDHADGLMAALQLGQPGETYLFGAGCEVSNNNLAVQICGLLDARCPRADGKSYAKLITFVADRPGHDFRYALDSSETEAALSWRATVQLETGLAKTVDWYLSNRQWLISPTELGRCGTRTEITGVGP